MGLLLLFFLAPGPVLADSPGASARRGQKSLAGWLGSRRARQATRLTPGTGQFVEGNWSRARRDLLRGVRENDTPLLNYLLAARASANLGEPEQTDQHLAAAEAGAGAKLPLPWPAQNYSCRRGTTSRPSIHWEARRSPGRYPQALALLQRAYAGLDDGAALAELLPLLKKYRVLNADEVQRLEAEVYGRGYDAGGRSVPRRQPAGTV